MTTDPSGSVADVRRVPTSGGNTRFVLVDSDGREYSTFREEIGTALEGGEGKRAHIRYHEQRRGRFTNVYLDDVRLLDNESPDASMEEEAWKTALDAAPYLLSGRAVDEETPAQEVFDKLKPFKDLVADDIAGEDEARPDARDEQ